MIGKKWIVVANCMVEKRKHDCGNRNPGSIIMVHTFVLLWNHHCICINWFVCSAIYTQCTCSIQSMTVWAVEVVENRVDFPLWCWIVTSDHKWGSTVMSFTSWIDYFSCSITVTIISHTIRGCSVLDLYKLYSHQLDHILAPLGQAHSLTSNGWQRRISKWIWLTS